MTTTLHLTRSQHDLMLSSKPDLLRALFAQCLNRSWSISGVTLHDLPDDLYHQATHIAGATS